MANNTVLLVMLLCFAVLMCEHVFWWYALHYILPVESYYKGAYGENSEIFKGPTLLWCVSNDANQ